MDILAAFAAMSEQNLRGALCVVVAAKGSTPRKAGAKMIVLAGARAGDIVGTVGGGAVEHRVRMDAMDAIKERQPRLITVALGQELGMCCGGEMSVYIEPMVEKAQIVIFGAGHIAQALSSLAQRLGFHVVVLDEREELLAHESFAQAQKIRDTSVFAQNSLTFTNQTFVVVVTHDHQLDQQIIEQMVRLSPRYLALVGSKRKALMTRKRLEAKGFHGEIEKVHCPAGIDIAAETPEEIAISIMAQIIQVKNGETINYGHHSRSGAELSHGDPQGVAQV
jgi:xanthine dehydrogenase accessory factor